MEEKLIKKSEDTYLLQYHIDDTVLEHCELFDGKLSLKNCEAIERGYDLDELAESLYLKSGPDGISDILSFKIGFQKALSILSDKKFSERDIKAAIRRGYVERQKDEGADVYFESYEEFLQSLKQTEWYVVHELGADGNLILKRKICGS